MKRKFILLICVLYAGVSVFSGCAKSSDGSSVPNQENSEVVTTAAKPAVTLPVTSKQPVNEILASYVEFGIDKTIKQDFNKKVSENCKIPIISVTTRDSEEIVSLEEYTSCVVDVFNCEDKFTIDEASAGIRVRGNSSAYYGDVNQILNNTVPYRIRFDTKTNMLGLNGGAEFRSWVLLKSDWDLIRNDIAFRMGRAIMDGKYFCSDSQLVHLYVNEEFQGIYLLCEQCQVNKNRVDVTEPEEGYTGTDIGYYLEMDNYAASDTDNYYITMDYCGAAVTDINGETRQFVPAEYSVKNDLYSQDQIDFIDKYADNLFKIVYEACENGNYLTFDENFDLTESQYKNAEETVRAVMDIGSAVDMYILYEIVHDYDCGEGSFYFCVDFSEKSRHSKLTFTSPWDFNWAYSDSPDGKYYAGGFCDQSFADQYGDRSNPWFILLIKQDWFLDAVSEKWSEMKNSDVLKNCISEETKILEKYKSDLNKTDEWATDCSYELIDWILNRIDWLDEQWLDRVA